VKVGHFRTSVVGLTFNPDYPDLIYKIEMRELNLSLARPGARVTLAFRRNPQNEHDANAIEVWLQPRLLTVTGFIGHLPRDVARRLAPELDEHGDDSWRAEIEKVVINDAHPDRPGLRILAWRRADGHPPKETWHDRDAPPVPRDDYY
jgi:hypothetical protein